MTTSGRMSQIGGVSVSSISLGCMGMSDHYGPADPIASMATIRRALDLGVNMLVTADIFGPFANEELVGRAIAGRRDEVLIATKFGSYRGESGRPDAVRAACDASLSRMALDTIDLYSQFRVDPEVPVEETWGAMSELVSAGKVRYLGICEVMPDTIRRAHSVYPVTAIESEFSLWTRDPEHEGVLDVARELGIGFIASSPLGRGFLAGAIQSIDQLHPADSRRNNPRFQPETLPKNVEWLQGLLGFASDHHLPLASVALAWVLGHEGVVAIPGPRTIGHLEADLAAGGITLSEEQTESLDRLAPYGVAHGDRYSNMTWVGA